MAQYVNKNLGFWTDFFGDLKLHTHALRRRFNSHKSGSYDGLAIVGNHPQTQRTLGQMQVGRCVTY